MKLQIAFKEEIEHALHMTHREMVEDAGEMWPRFLAFDHGPDKKLLWAQIDPAMMADWREKNKIGAMIVERCFDSKAVIFLSDGYCNTPAPGKTFDDYPRDFAEWPAGLKREALLVFVNARHMKGVSLAHAYTRGGKGQRIFAPEPELLPVSTSRFAFDLTQASRLSAALDALLRNRDGAREAQA
jgi:hypothetical protein